MTLTEAAAPAATVDTAIASPTNTAAAPAVAAPADWRADLPEDIRADPNVSKYETKEGFFKAHLNLVKMIGSDKVVIPKEGDEAGWNAFHKAAGRPDAPDGYGFKAPEKMPDGMTYSPELDQKFATEAHKLGLSTKQAQGLREWQMNVLAEGGKQAAGEFEASRATQETQLRTEWGRAYDQKLATAKAAVKEYAGDEFVALLETTGMGNHPALVKAFAAVGEKTMGDTQLINGQPREQAPADLDAAIADHRKEHNAALHDKSHPEHNARLNELTALMNKRFPEQAA